jgi:Ca2+-binding EF-hand superfamily protein
VETRPEKVKEGLAGILRSMKEKQPFFRKSDFESMFESYDFFSEKGGNQIPFTSLVQALEKINVSYTREEFLNAYPQFKLDRTVKKLDFINIMENEYKKKIRL